MMQIEIVLSIVGSFGTLALAVNAFFLKGIYTDLNDVKLKMTSIYSDSKHTSHEIERLDKELGRLRKKSHEDSNLIQVLITKLERCEGPK